MHSLVGLDGSNPLGFLAALGVLKTATSALADHDVRMVWAIERGAWRPTLHLSTTLTRGDLLAEFHRDLQSSGQLEAYCIDDDLKIPPQRFRELALMAQKETHSNGERRHADLVAALGCEVTVSDDGSIQDTALRTMSGSGHQHFLKTMRNIVAHCTPVHLEKALFRVWDYSDPVETLALRWDPSEDIRRALRWDDPSGDPMRKKRGSMLGAYRLAIEGLAMMPTLPVGAQLRTVGFKGKTSRDTYWSWPIWESPVSLDVSRSLISLEELQRERPDRSQLAPRGIVQVFRSQRITKKDKKRNFTPAEPA